MQSGRTLINNMLCTVKEIYGRKSFENNNHNTMTILDSVDFDATSSTKNLKSSQTTSQFDNEHIIKIL